VGSGVTEKMKKIILVALFLCAIPVSALWEGASSAKVGTADAGIAFLLPQHNLDFSDLDVRDAQNKPIPSASAKAELTTLFRENLLNLIVFANPHIMTQTMSYIDSILYLINNSIIKSLYVLFELFQEAFLPSTKRFVHNVHNLWATLFSYAAFAVTLLFARRAYSARLTLPLRL
jgi:hypothetical protein